MSRGRTILFFLLCLLLASAVSHAGVPEKNLPPRYRHWLTVEVPYIIETEERNAFLALHSDTERDNFIDQFWESRNPTPGAPINSFKEEHYRRFAYANEHFGDPNHEDGWRTDQGRIYITLGAPQSVATYPNARNVRPLVVWFFQSPSRALPSYFYVVFYKQSTSEAYQLYSPYQDGPARLVTTSLEDENDQRRSLKTLRNSLGDEVARLAISLIPTEPVNLDDYSPTMVSDSMLATIRGLPDNYLEKREVANNRRREHVTASIYTAANTPHVGYMVARDERGLSTVHFLIQFPEPDPTLVGQRKNGTLGYDMTLRTHVTTLSGKSVYENVDMLTGYLQPAQADAGRKKAFSAEERLPLAPGTYLVEATLTNNLDLQAHRFTQQVVVPAPEPTRLGMSQVLVFHGNPTRDDGDPLPFSFSNLRFTPNAIESVTIHPGDPIPSVFQLWLPKGPNGTALKSPVQLHYAFAAPYLTARPMDESDETVNPSNADAAGNLITGHTFETTTLTPGVYRLLIRATQPGSTPVSTTVTVRVVPSDVPVGSWSAYGPPEPAQDQSKRALSAKAQGLH